VGGWGHEQIEEMFPRGVGTHGTGGASRRARGLPPSIEGEIHSEPWPEGESSMAINWDAFSSIALVVIAVAMATVFLYWFSRNRTFARSWSARP